MVVRVLARFSSSRSCWETAVSEWRTIACRMSMRTRSLRSSAVDVEVSLLLPCSWLSFSEELEAAAAAFSTSSPRSDPSLDE